MDTPDRSPGALSPWSSPTPSPSLYPSPWEEPAREPAAPKSFGARVVLRALRRHWWQILALWLVGSAGLVYLAYTRVKPLYEVVSVIEVSPPARSLLSPSSASAEAFEPYLETQVLLVTSPDVIANAIRDPAIAGLPMVRNSIDPEVELRKEIAAIPQKGTHLIQVSMVDADAVQAAAIVNAVVKSYVDKAKDWTDGATRQQIEVLQGLRTTYEASVRQQQDRLRTLGKKTGEIPEAVATKAGQENGPAPLGRSRMTIEEFRRLKAEHAGAHVAKLEAEADVAHYRKELAEGPRAGPARPSPEQVEALVQEEFSRLPQVAQLSDDIAAEEAKLQIARSKVRSTMDPSTRHLKKSLEDLKAQYEDLWARMYPSLKARLIQPETPPLDAMTQARLQALQQAEKAVRGALIRENFLQDQIRTAEVEAKVANDEIVEVQFAQADLEYGEELLKTVKRHLEQLELEEKNGTKIEVRFAARPSRYPSSNGRVKMMAAAPVLMFLLTAGLFVLLEFRGGRVADAEELSQRARLGVIGVVPPLPSLGSSTRALSLRGRRDEKRRIEEFVQSLDHLRVTLCAPRPGQSHRRCVLITSATGGEGKTTLAAQLAGRCANAGLMTLLIDADLRRPSLGDLLEVPEGPGLVDVLAGEASPEAAMVVIGNAGGFHLLPAGSTGRDPSRLLHGERLGQLMAQLRETFDMVIIDAPPVLAVPDALLLGRWVDGAVLAVRHDTSRFPLVERANQRLASIGVPVLGAVINGGRTAEAGYGAYRYTPYAAAAADEPGAGTGRGDD